MQILETKEVKKYYPTPSGIVRALDGVSLSDMGAGNSTEGNVRRRKDSVSEKKYRICFSEL